MPWKVIGVAGGLALGAALVIAVSVVRSGDGKPPPLPRNGLIAYVTREPWSTHIATVSPRGADRRLVTAVLPFARDPAWSPDGDLIVFGAESGSLLLVSGAGRGLRVLTHPSRRTAADRLPAWSRDGRHIAFVRLARGGQSIWVVSRDGRGERRLGAPDVDDEGPVRWSRDGRWIEYESSRGGVAWRVSVSRPSRRERVVEPAPCRRLVAWAPDGQTAVCEDTDHRADDSGYSDLWLAAPGSPPRRLTRTRGEADYNVTWLAGGRAFTHCVSGRALSLVRRRADGSHPVTLARGTCGAVSPDGRRHAWAANESRLTTARLPAGPPQPLLGRPAADSLPVWAPDGRRLAFLRTRWSAGDLTAGEVRVVDVAGGGERLVASLGDVRSLTWSPDASRLLVGVMDADGDATGLYLVSADGGPAAPLVRGPWSSPAWSPDGSAIAFIVDDRPHVIRSRRRGEPAELFIVGTATSLSWAPDGERLAVTLGASPRGAGLAVLERDGDEVGFIAAPVRGSTSWSPDGEQILALADSGPAIPDLIVMNARSRDVRTAARAVLRAAWSPDGRRILVVRDARGDGATTIDVVDPAGEAPPRRVARTAFDPEPSWQPVP